MIDLVHETDEVLKIEPSQWDFNGELNSENFENMMIENMIGHKGVGLSANQIGMPFKVFSMLVDGKTPIVCFNPSILSVSEEIVNIKEGCLSYPQLWLNVKRPKSVVVSYQTAKGDRIQESFDGFESRIFQHEMDHMMGKNFTEKVSKIFLTSARKKQRLALRKLSHGK